MTKKKIYEKPSMQVVQLKQQTHLLQASGQARVQNYENWYDVPEE